VRERNKLRERIAFYISHRSQTLISVRERKREFGRERERQKQREALWGFETQRATAMAESNDSVSVDMEKIYLGGKVRVFLHESIRFYGFYVCSLIMNQFEAVFCIVPIPSCTAFEWIGGGWCPVCLVRKIGKEMGLFCCLEYRRVRIIGFSSFSSQQNDGFFFFPQLMERFDFCGIEGGNDDFQIWAFFYF
jgi:hypothetical protein